MNSPYKSCQGLSRLNRAIASQWLAGGGLQGLVELPIPLEGLLLTE